MLETAQFFQLVNRQLCMRCVLRSKSDLNCLFSLTMFNFVNILSLCVYIQDFHIDVDVCACVSCFNEAVCKSGFSRLSIVLPCVQCIFVRNCALSTLCRICCYLGSLICKVQVKYHKTQVTIQSKLLYTNPQTKQSTYRQKTLAKYSWLRYR